MITGDSNGSGAGMQIMGAGAEGVEIMGAADGVEIMGAADAPGGAPVSPAMIMTPVHKHLSTAEKVGAVGVVLLIAGAVAYSMKK